MLTTEALANLTNFMSFTDLLPQALEADDGSLPTQAL